MFSIIIPCRIFNNRLAETLDKLSVQTYRNFEVIVILDFEDSNLISSENVNYIFSGIKTPGEKRNIGINSSKGDYIAFLDDDAYPSEKWLENAKIIFDSTPEFIGVCGPSITPPDSSLLEQIGGYIYESFLTSGPTRYRHLPQSSRIVNDYPTVNLIVKKECMNEVGGFDIKYWPGEDTKLCLDLTKKYGKRIFYSPILVVYHYRRSVFHPHLIQLSRYASHRGFFAKEFPETSLKLTYFIPSLFVLYLLLLPILLLNIKNSAFLLIPLGLYLLILSIESALIYNKSGSLAKSILAAFGIFFSNVTYGVFFLKGLLSKPNLVLREVDILNEKYIKG
jgi:glycosyltransferase involved in cell wall biosynthesis